jgi:hypothetical protein
MPLPKTYEEFLAEKLNPRNYSDILPIIYKLKTRQNAEYVPTAFNKIVYSTLRVGENGASATFNALAATQFSKNNITGGSLVVGSGYTIISNSGGANFTNVGAANNDIGTVFKATGTNPTWGTGELGNAIVLEGTATYKLMSGATLIELKSAIKITAQIDIGRSNPPDSLPAFQVECAANEIITTSGGTFGNFSFFIPTEIIQKLSIGEHTVYIDAHSPNNLPVRLTASQAENNVRRFTITG